MEKFDVRELEKLIIEKYQNDVDYKIFLEENSKKEILFNAESSSIKELEDMEEFAEETVIDYLDEIANLEVISDEEEKDIFENFEAGDKEQIVIKYLGEAASVAFNYVKDGIAYMDIVQEGTVGLIKAIDNYVPELNGEFKNYAKYWIIREIVLFIQNKIEDIRYEFKNYFKIKKENFGKEHHHENEEIHEQGEIYLKEEDLLPNIEAVEKREKLVDKKINFFALNNRVSLRQVEVLNLYFGFGKERRYSIFEIEDMLKLEKGQGEEIFQEALLILSTVEGKIAL